MITITILSILLVVTLCILTYYSYTNKFVKLLALPLLLSLFFTSYNHYLSEMGKPFPFPLPEEAEYVFHKITSEDTILVWLSDEESGDRLYVIPYTREAAKELQEAKEKGEEGIPQQITSTQQPSGEYTVNTEDSRRGIGQTILLKDE